MSDHSAGLAALADPVRRQILDSLSESGPQSASALASGFDITRQAVSKHLKQLEAAGLIGRSTNGRAVLYEVDRRAISDTAMWLAATTQRWNERLDRLGGLLH
ncbi:MAG: metalloregulator ArsR/SmtB family transcription factor [Acidimicrobiales bacterium]